MSDRHVDLHVNLATFALHSFRYDDDEPLEVVGWGMVLPDGTAVAIGWCDGVPGGIAVCGSADRAAFIFDADVVWTTTAAFGS